MTKEERDIRKVIETIFAIAEPKKKTVNFMLEKYPDVLTLYRYITLNKPEELNKKNLGQSWFSNFNRTEEYHLLIQLRFLCILNFVAISFLEYQLFLLEFLLLLNINIFHL